MRCSSRPCCWRLLRPGAVHMVFIWRMTDGFCLCILHLWTQPGLHCGGIDDQHHRRQGRPPLPELPPRFLRLRGLPGQDLLGHENQMLQEAAPVGVCCSGQCGQAFIRSVFHCEGPSATDAIRLGHGCWRLSKSGPVHTLFMPCRYGGRDGPLSVHNREPCRHLRRANCAYLRELGVLTHGPPFAPSKLCILEGVGGVDARAQIRGRADVAGQPSASLKMGGATLADVIPPYLTRGILGPSSPPYMIPKRYMMLFGCHGDRFSSW